MTRPHPLQHPALRALLATGLLALASISAHAAAWSGRGVFGFNTAQGCPLVTAGATAAPCNRIALDDADTHASVDETARVIRFSNARSYATKTIVGDVLLQGSGVAADGQRVPLNFHITLSKKGQDWSVSRHAHAPVRGRFSELRIDAFQVEAGAPGTERTVVSPAEVLQALAQPGVRARVASELVTVRDNRNAQARDPDITIGVGLGRAALPVMRAALHAPALAAGQPHTLDALLQQGTWSLDLSALSSQIPDQVAQRELFLFGMQDQPLLQPVRERGFRKHERMTVGAVAGKGYLRVGEQQQDFPGAAEAGRRFMQQSFIGLVLGWQQLHPEVVPGAR